MFSCIEPGLPGKQCTYDEHIFMEHGAQVAQLSSIDNSNIEFFVITIRPQRDTKCFAWLYR
jgi:hypothetical protein